MTCQCPDRTPADKQEQRTWLGYSGNVELEELRCIVEPANANKIVAFFGEMKIVDDFAQTKSGLVGEL